MSSHPHGTSDAGLARSGPDGAPAMNAPAALAGGPAARPGKALAWAGVLAATAAAAAAAAAALLGQQSTAASAGAGGALAAEFCDTAPLEAQVGPTDARTRTFAAQVPHEPPPIGLPVGAAHAVAKGDVVEFMVTSPRGGALAVHGLFGPRPVAAGEAVKVAFRAIYTGRFPLHFHGDDGSHFEIAALEVTGRASAAVAQPVARAAAAGAQGRGGQS